MKKIGSTKQKMLDLLRDQCLSPLDLQQALGISASVVHGHLRFLLREGFVEKVGSAPRVCYIVRKESAADAVNEHFVFQDSLGKLHHGMDGFRLWSQQGLKKMSFEEKIALYADRISVMQSNRKGFFFDLTGKLQKVKDVGEDVYLKELASLSLRTLQDFGRTKMGVYMDVVKGIGTSTAAVMDIMDMILDFSVPLIIAYAKKHQVNAVGFISPTRKRQNQIMTFLEKRFRKGPLRVAAVDIKKIRGPIFREQKTIRDLRDRIHNANRTFQISPYSHVHNYKRILLVDDFVGSGTTLNQVAKMLRQSGFAGEVFGLGVVGEERGYSIEKVS